MKSFNFDFFPLIVFVIFLVIHLIVGKKPSKAQTEGNGSEF
jgi:hypothetical protein